MPAPIHPDSLPDELRPAAQFVLRRLLADDIPDYADGRLDADPDHKALVEAVLRADPEARRQLEEYRKLCAPLTDDEKSEFARRILARIRGQAPAGDGDASPANPGGAPDELRTLPFPIPAPDSMFAMAAHELPQMLNLSQLLRGFSVEASESVLQPGEATTLRISREVVPGENAQPSVVMHWPGGTSDPLLFADEFGGWVAKADVLVPWKDAVEFANQQQIRLSMGKD